MFFSPTSALLLSQGLFSLNTEVGLIPSVVSSLLDPFLSNKDLLGDLHKDDITTPYI